MNKLRGANRSIRGMPRPARTRVGTLPTMESDRARGALRDLQRRELAVGAQIFGKLKDPSLSLNYYCRIGRLGN